MTAAVDSDRFRQPLIKRLGLDDGWWYFCPHFLNLGLPLVFVDACLLPEAQQLGLEVFGTREPADPLPTVDLHVELLGGGVSLYTAGRPRVAEHWFRMTTLTPALHASPRVGILVGDSYAVQLSLSALWTCRIRTAAEVLARLDWPLSMGTGRAASRAG